MKECPRCQGSGIRYNNGVEAETQCGRCNGTGMVMMEQTVSVQDAYAIHPRSTWRHRDGGIYAVITVANGAADDPVKWPVTVVYGDAEGNVWARPATEFIKTMTRLENQG